MTLIATVGDLQILFEQGRVVLQRGDRWAVRLSRRRAAELAEALDQAASGRWPDD